MSLLMDALKRAEKARQAEAERAKAEGRVDESPELSLDPIDEPAPEPEGGPGRDQGTEVRATSPGSDTEDSLEFTPEAVRRAVESMPEPAFEDSATRWDEEKEAPTRTGAGDGTTALSLEYGDVPLEDTASTLPSMRAAQRSVQDYFDGTQSVSMSMEGVDDAMEAEETAGSTGTQPNRRPPPLEQEDTASRRQARAVLDARAVAPSNSLRNVGLIIVIVLLVGVVAGGGFMYKDRIIALFGTQPTVVAGAPPPAVRREPVAAVAPQAGPVAADEREALLRAAQAARAEERRLAEESAARAAAEQQAEAEAAARRAAEAEARQAAQASAAEVASTSAGAEVPLEQVLRGTPGSLPPAPSTFNITRSQRVNRNHTRLMDAFGAFQRGDDAAAMTLYQQVLSRQPRNRDALLGAAAVLTRAGEYQQAAAHYALVLSRNPGDPAAQAGLIALQENLDPVSGESRIKSLLENNPRDAYLHFTLGNLFAEQGRWPEAQQAFFDAYRLDEANPDYAFNLAVSLDRLSQSRAALDYYRLATELAGKQPASFESAAAARRVAALEGS